MKSQEGPGKSFLLVLVCLGSANEGIVEFIAKVTERLETEMRVKVLSITQGLLNDQSDFLGITIRVPKELVPKSRLWHEVFLPRTSFPGKNKKVSAEFLEVYLEWEHEDCVSLTYSVPKGAIVDLHPGIEVEC